MVRSTRPTRNKLYCPNAGVSSYVHADTPHGNSFPPVLLCETNLASQRALVMRLNWDNERALQSFAPVYMHNGATTARRESCLLIIVEGHPMARSHRQLQGDDFRDVAPSSENPSNALAVVVRQDLPPWSDVASSRVLVLLFLNYMRFQGQCQYGHGYHTLHHPRCVRRVACPRRFPMCTASTRTLPPSPLTETTTC